MTVQIIKRADKPDGKDNNLGPAEHDANWENVKVAVEALQTAVEELQNAPTINAPVIEQSVSNVQDNQTAIIQQIITMGERVSVLEQMPGSAIDPDGSPGAPLEAVNPIGPPPRPQGQYNYNDFTSHYFSNDGGSHRMQSNFNIRTTVSGWYKFKFKGFIAHDNSGSYNEIIQVRERDGLWYFLETTAYGFVENGSGGTLPAQYTAEGQVALNAHTDYAINLYGSNQLPNHSNVALKEGFIFEYDLELIAQFVNPDYKRPETWGHIHCRMEATGRKTSRGDLIYIMRSNRPGATTSARVPGPELKAGATVKIHWFNSVETDLVQVKYDTDKDGLGDSTVLMTYRKADDSQQWDFAGRPVTLEGDYWTAEYTPTEDGQLIFEPAMNTATDDREYAAFIVE